MSLPREFWEELPQKSDTELFQMLAHKEDYFAEALAAAKAELSKRNVAPERMAELEKKLESEKKAESAKAELRLAVPLRVIIFLFCGGIVGVYWPCITPTTGTRGKPATAGLQWA